jgi:hypothetical protein
MIMIGMTFRAWLLNTTTAYPPRALMKMSFTRETLRGITEEARKERAEFDAGRA